MAIINSIHNSSNDLTILSGNIYLPDCVSALSGAIFGQSDSLMAPLLHTYGDDIGGGIAGNNIFLGFQCGNFTMTQGVARFNTGFGGGNSITGFGCLSSLTTGSENCGFGYQTMRALDTGTANCAFGTQALYQITSGSNNIAIAGDNILAGGAYTGAESSNIVIGNTGVVGESNVMRLGTTGGGAGQQNTTYIAGISGATVVGAGVLCDAAGLLGTIVSSRRFKENIEDMGAASSDIFKLRPVIFNLKKPESPNHRHITEKQVGLIAEEVMDIMPGLVVLDQENQPASVKYHDLPVLLLNEMQKMIKRIESLEVQLAMKGN